MRRALPRALHAFAVLVVLAASPASLGAQALGTAFTHQGRLLDTGVPANGPYDFRCTLHDAAGGGAQVGPTLTLNDVAVSGGLYTVNLDFGGGPAVYSGQARWLQIAVRPGASTGAYALIGSRQELQPAPGAMFAATAPWTGVVSKPPGFADDVDNDSGGTVTSVAAGAGLTGGPIVNSGTLSVANAGIGSAMIANGAVQTGHIAAGAVQSSHFAGGAVGLGQIDAAQVQARISGTCALGSYLRGFNADGTVVCVGLPNPHVLSVVDDPAANLVGAFASMAVGADGLPVISYFDETAGALKVAKCGNAACTLGNTSTTVDDPANTVGFHTSIAVGADGRPVVSYHDLTAGALKVAKCGNAACSAGNVITTVDDLPAGSVGEYTSIAVGAGGLPVISYIDAAAGSLKVVRCGTAACDTLNTTTTVDDPVNLLGLGTSIAVPADGQPVISYFEFTTNALKVAKCGNASCSAGNVITTVDDPPNGVGAGSSIAIGGDGLPVISYQDQTAGNLKVAKCGNAACNAGNVITTVDPSANTVGLFSDIAVPADGRPVISYQDGSTTALKIAKCGNAACSAGNVVSVLDDPPNVDVGAYTSIGVAADGLPIVAHADRTADALRVAKCGNAACAP